MSAVRLFVLSALAEHGPMHGHQIRNQAQSQDPQYYAFLKSMEIVKDFWAEPTYAELLLDMQKRVHDYVVADKGTAKEALDLLVKDWNKVFKAAGKN